MVGGTNYLVKLLKKIINGKIYIYFDKMKLKFKEIYLVCIKCPTINKYFAQQDILISQNKSMHS